jgi:hypothetical protein
VIVWRAKCPHYEERTTSEPDTAHAFRCWKCNPRDSFHAPWLRYEVTEVVRWQVVRPDGSARGIRDTKRQAQAWRDAHGSGRVVRVVKRTLRPARGGRS